MGFPYSYSRAATASVEYAKLFYCRRQACHHRDTIKFSEFTFWNYQLFWKHVCFFFSFLIENLLIINTRKWQIISSDLKLFVNLSIFLFFNSSILRRPATMTRNRCFFPSIVCNQSSTLMTLHSCLVLSTSGRRTKLSMGGPIFRSKQSIYFVKINLNNQKDHPIWKPKVWIL